MTMTDEQQMEYELAEWVRRRDPQFARLDEWVRRWFELRDATRGEPIDREEALEQILGDMPNGYLPSWDGLMRDWQREAVRTALEEEK